jgi:hypothetical protein
VAVLFVNVVVAVTSHMYADHVIATQEDRMLILEPNGQLDRHPRPRRSLLKSFWEMLARLLQWA